MSLHVSTVEECLKNTAAGNKTLHDVSLHGTEYNTYIIIHSIIMSLDFTL